MSKKGNERKSKQLGMNHATAANRLRKMILFKLIQEASLDNCYQCGERIENVENLSIEHTKPWLDSDDPVGLYFDLDNIAFSHLSCNASNGRRHRGPRVTTEHGSRAMYVRHKCRCKPCRDGNAEYIRNWRERNSHSEI